MFRPCFIGSALVAALALESEDKFDAVSESSPGEAGAELCDATGFIQKKGLVLNVENGSLDTRRRIIRPANCRVCSTGLYNDGCNDCTCLDGKPSCSTEKACLVQGVPSCTEKPAAAVGCKTCESGLYFDGCNNCKCMPGGMAVCTKRACNELETPVCTEVKKSEVKECGKRQHWSECGSACPPTCSKLNPICTMQCVAGCKCNRGFLLNSKKKCVRKNKKFCRKERQQCGFRQQWSECGSACNPTCSELNPICNKMCVAGCKCKSGFVLNFKKKCVKKNKKCCRHERMKCGEHMERKKCGSTCSPSCKVPNQICTADCAKKPKCECKQGFVRNSKKKCVKTNEKSCRKERGE